MKTTLMVVLLTKMKLKNLSPMELLELKEDPKLTKIEFETVQMEILNRLK